MHAGQESVPATACYGLTHSGNMTCWESANANSSLHLLLPATSSLHLLLPATSSLHLLLPLPVCQPPTHSWLLPAPPSQPLAHGAHRVHVFPQPACPQHWYWLLHPPHPPPCYACLLHPPTRRAHGVPACFTHLHAVPMVYLPASPTYTPCPWCTSCHSPSARTPAPWR